jgi:hypothetical protein
MDPLDRLPDVATNFVTRIAAGKPDQSLLLCDRDRDELSHQLSGLLSAAREQGALTAYARVGKPAHWERLYDQLRAQLELQAVQQENRDMLNNTLDLAGDADRLADLTRAQRLALPRLGVILGLDRLDLLARPQLRQLHLLLKRANIYAAPLAVAASAPDGRVLQRAYEVYPDACMMWASTASSSAQ